MPITALNAGISLNNIETKRFETFVSRGMDNVSFFNGIASRFLNEKSNINQAANIFGLASDFSLESAGVCQNLLSEINSEINKLNLELNMTNTVFPKSKKEDEKKDNDKAKQFNIRFHGINSRNTHFGQSTQSYKQINTDNKYAMVQNTEKDKLPEPPKVIEVDKTKADKLPESAKVVEVDKTKVDKLPESPKDEVDKTVTDKQESFQQKAQAEEARKIYDALQQEKKNAEEYNSDADIQFKTLKISADNNELQAKTKFYNCQNSRVMGTNDVLSNQTTGINVNNDIKFTFPN